MTSNIQTKAFNLPYKPKKEDVQDYIEKLYNTTQDNQDKARLAELYKFFMPTPPAKCKDLKQWVTKALNLNHDRPTLQAAYCDGENYIATDGHRMHIIPLTLFPTGYYDHKLNKLDIDLIYPEYKRLIPTKTLKDKLIVTSGIIDKNKDITFHLFNAPIKFNLRYITELMNGDKEATVYCSEVYIRGNINASPVLFEFVDRSAVLMPKGE